MVLSAQSACSIQICAIEALTLLAITLWRGFIDCQCNEAIVKQIASTYDLEEGHHTLAGVDSKTS